MIGTVVMTPTIRTPYLVWVNFKEGKLISHKAAKQDTEKISVLLVFVAGGFSRGAA